MNRTRRKRTVAQKKPDPARLDHSAENERLRAENWELKKRNSRQLRIIERMEDRAERRENKLRLLLQEISERQGIPDWLRKLPLVREAYAEFQPRLLDEFDGELPPADVAPLAVLEAHSMDLRTINALAEAGVETVGELLDKSQTFVLGVENLSHTSLEKIHAALRSAGYLDADEELPREEEDR